MKKFIVPFLVAGVCFTACNQDLLEVEQKGVNTPETFYSSDDDAYSAKMAMYATWNEEIGGTEGIWNAYLMGLNYSSDDVFAAGESIHDHEGFREVNEFRYDNATSIIKTLYSRLYKSIYPANLVITYFGGEKANTPAKKQAVAEARVVRAWCHMIAAMVYNQPPLIDHLIEPSENPTNDKTMKEILEWCTKECEEAMADLKEREGQSDKVGAYMVTKGFAQYVAGKAALYAENYDKVISCLKPLVESPNYALVPGDRFRDLFHVEGDGCEEKLFEFNYSANTEVAGGNDSWRSYNIRGRWMVANVLNWRGDYIQGSGTAVKIISCNGWGGGAINDQFAHKMYKHEPDSYRRKATFVTSDELFYDETLVPWKSDFDSDGNSKGLTKEEKGKDSKRGVKYTGGVFSYCDMWQVKNLMAPTDQGFNDTDNNTNFSLGRLAEAYLMYAEACIQKGQLDEAKKYINMIQERAGAPKSASVDLQTLKDEKQYELWFEGCRWKDLVRWGDDIEAYEKVLDNIPYAYDEYYCKQNAAGEWEKDKDKGSKPHNLVYVIKHPFADNKTPLKYEQKHRFWPIPKDVMEVNHNMKQNPGW